MDNPCSGAVESARQMEGSLDERLEVVREACRIYHPEYDALLDDFSARLAKAGIAGFAPRPGEHFPTLPDEHGRIVRLDVTRGDGPVVVVFLRGVWCSFCRLHLLALAEVADDLRAAGARILAISPQKSDAAVQHREGAGATFPLLCDAGRGLATVLGLTATLDERLHERLAGAGIDLPPSTATEAGPSQSPRRSSSTATGWWRRGTSTRTRAGAGSRPTSFRW